MEKRGDINPAYTPATSNEKEAQCGADSSVSRRIAALDHDLTKQAADATANTLKEDDLCR